MVFASICFTSNFKFFENLTKINACISFKIQTQFPVNIVYMNRTNYPMSSNSHPSATANKARHVFIRRVKADIIEL